MVLSKSKAQHANRCGGELHRANLLKEDEMKRFVLFLLFAAVMTSAAAFAQGFDEGIKANVPFAFVAGDKTIPAGNCVVRTEGFTKGALSISNHDAKAATYVVPQPTESLAPATKTVLVFNKYGDSYFLARVERSGSSAGYQLKPTKVEKELRARTDSPIQMVRLELQ